MERGYYFDTDAARVHFKRYNSNFPLELYALSEKVLKGMLDKRF